MTAAPVVAAFAARWRIGAAALLLCLLTFAAPAQAPLPALDSPVQDPTGSLDAATRARLETRARELRERRGAQLQVLIVASTAPEDIAAYAQRVFDAWKLGRAGVDDGVLLVVAREDRRARIQVGYGLEGRIADAQAQRVLADYLLPHLGRGEYAEGVDAASAALAALIEQEPLPPPAAADYRADAGAAPAWRPLDWICAAGAGFALALGWCARRRGWALAAAAPAALLPPALAAWIWSGPAAVWAPLLWAAAAGALGQALPQYRWLRSVAGTVAVGLAVATVAAALVRRGAPAPGDIGVAAMAVLFALPLLLGAIAPPIIAWQRGALSFAVRAGLVAGLAWFGWRALQRWSGGDLSALDAGSWLGAGIAAYIAWMAVFLFEREGGGRRTSAARDGRRRGSGDKDGRTRSASGSGPSSSSDSGSSDTGWSGGGGRSGGGGASGSW
ncbi:TPM domain-containing protein [Lysobacter enzymogenes]|uniref:TPM domain-containing protein n=1 Tax=Lysobacter enzymogenes TaxID=69 RepID=UPI001A96A0C9|nr:TPM domain-containing protein [Lysobacter enzymogenes]QQP98349.1 TPM domain-containing protein [Lysobacter enzymogenes]